MADFSKLVITTNGQSLIAKLIAGTVTDVEFTTVAASSAAYDEDDLEALEELSDIEQTVSVSKVTVSNDTAVKVEAAFTNSDLTTGYYMRTIGLYANDPDEGEILYAATVESTGNCYIPAYNGVSTTGVYLKLITTVGNSNNVSVELDLAAVATIGDIEDLQEQIDALVTPADSLDSDTTYTHGISGGIPYILVSGGSESDKIYLITQAMKEGTYDGRNLAETFASEIASYSDEWEWIKDRIDSGYLGDLFTCDYIPIETTDGYSFDMQIMGINTYTGYGSTEIGNMIDFCSRTVHPTSTYFNSSNNNNGSSDNANPFMASYLKTTFLDTVVYPTLPSSVTAQISAKHQYIESRYSSSSTLTDSTTQTWQDIDGLWVPSEMEVTGHIGWGTQGYSHCGDIQYPYFVHMHNRVKKNPSGSRCNWWLTTPGSSNSTHVCLVSAYGVAGNYTASSSHYAPLCFRIAA